MRVFVAGTARAIGKQLVAAGHEVRGTTRRQPELAMLHELGAVPVVAKWLPALARIPGAEQPMRAPRLAAGESGAVLMTQLRGASNATAKRQLGWQPAQPSWRQGLAT
jgi:nucleoside-diphosphate-sugar epimerase